MAFDGTEGEQIDLAESVSWTANYRAANDGVYAHFFGRDILEQILDQEDCMGIRIYYALDDDEVSQLILVGVNAEEEDLYEGIVAERSLPCPPHSSHSPLGGG